MSNINSNLDLNSNMQQNLQQNTLENKLENTSENKSENTNIINIENNLVENKETQQNQQQTNKENILPKISLITPTYNKHAFIKLAIENFYNIDYPKDLIEWIIVDDSDKPINLPDKAKEDERIKYYYFTKEDIKNLYSKFVIEFHKNRKKFNNMSQYERKKNKLKKDTLKFTQPFKHIPIGMKRNICCQYTTGKYIFHFDDDDLYYPQNINQRLKHLTENNAVGCVNLGGFHITKMISIGIKSPSNLPHHKCTSCATLGYSKKFWQNKKFNNQDTNNESEYFLKNRPFVELEHDNIMVALFHKYNENENMFKGESNGWHFNKLDDKLFILITTLITNDNPVNKIESMY